MSGLMTRLRQRLALDRQLLPVLSVVLVGVFVSTLLAYMHTRDAVEDLAQNQTVQSLSFLDHEVSVQVRDMVHQTLLLSQEGLLRLALEDSYLGQSARAAVQRKVEGLVQRGAFERFYLMNLKGVMVLASNPALAGTLDVSDRRYFTEARAGKHVLETIVVSRVSKRSILVSSQPVRAQNGVVLGVLVGISDTASFARDILNKMRLGQKGGGYLLHESGAVLARPLWAAEEDFSPGAFARQILDNANGDTVLHYASNGRQRLCAARVNESTGWTLVVEADEGEVLAPANRLAAFGAGVSFLTLALVAFALGALRRVMANLRTSEADHRTLTDLSPVGVVTCDQAGRPVFMNMQARKILELETDAPLPDSIPLEDDQGGLLQGEDSPLNAVLTQHRSIIGQLTWLRAPSGLRKALNINATPLSGQGGHQAGVLVATLEDITERMQSLQMLHQSEERFSSLFRLSPDSILLSELESGTVVDTNEAFTETFGYSHAEAVGRTVRDLALYVDDEQRRAVQEQVLREGHVLNAQVLGKSKDGRQAVFSLSSQIMEIGESRFRMTVVRDITEQVQALERLKESEERFSTLFRLSPEAIALMEVETARMADVSDNFLRLSGYEMDELLGRSSVDIGFYANEFERKRLYELLARDGAVENFEFEGLRKDGQIVHCSMTCRVIVISGKKYYLAMLRDVSEIKKMNEMMIQTEKMISVGGIAAGIAHEINNPLGIVLQAAQNLVQRTKPDFPKNQEAAAKLGISMEQIQQYMQARKLDAFIQDIQTAAVRASSIIRHMLDFSRRSESRRKVCDLPGIVDKAVTLAASDYDLKKSYDFKRIHIVREYDDELPTINCTETEIEQVLLNLLRNSAQALAAATPPVEDARIALRVKGLPDHIRIEIEDNGPGIPPEIQRRIFEPFYTTKAPGVGTGLGLSVSYFIITKGHGGQMTVSSQPGSGTTFIILLPTDESRER